MTGNPPAYGDEDRRKHLDHIQAVIARLASGSNSAKGFTITIAAAAFGFSAVNRVWYLSLLGIAVIACLSLLDMHYLYQERLFRNLSSAVADGTATNYNMKKDDFKGQATRSDTFKSWSILGLYLPLLITGLTVVAIALATAQPGGAEHDPGASPSATPTATTR